jgi:hypothetical protein
MPCPLHPPRNRSNPELSIFSAFNLCNFFGVNPMTENFTRFLLEHFPERGTLSHENFTRASTDEPIVMNDAVECYAYDYDRELAERAFTIISRPWPEIDWFQIGSGGWMVPIFLNRKSFLHAFPSLLNYLHIISSNPDQSDMLTDICVQTLDLDYLKRDETEIWGEGVFDWKRNYYFSLNADVKKAICKILLRLDDFYDAKDALASYWVQFTEEFPP